MPKSENLDFSFLKEMTRKMVKRNYENIFILFRYHELTKDIKHNKGGILRAAVAYLRSLKTDQIKKQRIEAKCRIQDLQKRKMMMKLQVSYNSILDFFYYVRI